MRPKRLLATYAVIAVVAAAGVTSAAVTSAAAATPPVLTSVSLVSGPSASGTVTVSYAVDGAVAPLQKVVFAYSHTSSFQAITGVSLPPSGELTAGGFGEPGPYVLGGVDVTDADGQLRSYARDGHIYDQFNLDVGTHSLDMSALDVIGPAQAPVPQARTGPGFARLSWTFRGAIGGYTTGTRIHVMPGDRTLTVPVVGGDNVGAVQGTTVSGLTNGQQYTVTLAETTPHGDGAPATILVTPHLSTNVVGLGDFTGDRRPDFLGYFPDRAGAAYVYRGTGAGDVATSSRLLSGSLEASRVASGGDLNGDGKADLMVVNRFGHLQLDYGSGKGTIGSWAEVKTGDWSSMLALDAGVDFSGDRRTDLLAVTPAGTLYLYCGDAHGHFGSAARIGTGWGTMLAVFSPGDFNGDGRNDVLAVDRSGAMWLYRGNAAGGFLGGRTLVGSGWQGMGSVFALRDFTGDGRMDIGAETMGGAVYVFPGSGTGQLRRSTLIGTGFAGTL